MKCSTSVPLSDNTQVLWLGCQHSSSRRYSCTRSFDHQTTPQYLADMEKCIKSTRVDEFHATWHTSLYRCVFGWLIDWLTPSSLGRSRESCGAAMQNNKIRKAKFSRVCSINLELITDDSSQRFYFNDQSHSTFESWTVSQSLRNWLSAYVTVIC